MQRKTFDNLNRVFLGIIFWTLFASSSFAQSFGSVTLAWNANPGTDNVAGYNVYYGTSTGNYTNKVNAGDATTATLSNLPVGTCYFAITAINSQAIESAYSSEVSATVIAPSVSLTAPSSNAQFSAPATITLTASASEVGGSIDHVDFFNGTTQVGAATKSPYTIVWKDVPQGSYSLTAEAVDTLGGSTVSAPLSIVVGPNLSGFAGAFTGVGTTSAGGAMLVSLTMTKTGGFTGRVVDGIVASAISGTFNASGVATVTVRPLHQTPYTLVLTLDSNNNSITVNEPANSSLAPITLDQSPYTAKNPVTAGAFTMVLGELTVIPPSSPSAASTAPGFATVTIAATGAVRITGVLADTTPFSASAQLLADGTFVLYALPYGGLNGYLAGQITMMDTPGVSDGAGTLTWVKPPQPKHMPYSAGWSGTVAAQLSAFQKLASKPAAGTNIYATVSGAALPAGTSPVQANLLIFQGAPGLLEAVATPIRLNISQNSGLFSGTFRATSKSAAQTVRGVVFQKTQGGAGYFVAPTAVGTVDLSNAPIPIPQSSGVGFSPTSIAGCALWLDASLESYSNGASVPTWSDRSGQGNNAIANGSAGPTYALDAINGLPAMSFNGSNQILQFNDSSIRTSAFSVFIVFVQTGGTSEACPVNISNGWAFSFTNGRMSWYGSNLQTIGAYNDSSPTVMGAVQSGSMVNVWQNGGSNLSQGGFSISYGSDAGGYIGQATPDFLPFTGLIGEILIYNNALNTTQINNITAYLGTKWGIAVTQ